MRIAYEHADSFITYPQAPNLSAKAQPIRERLTYPRAPNLSASGTPASRRDAHLLCCRSGWVAGARSLR